VFVNQPAFAIDSIRSLQFPAPETATELARGAGHSGLLNLMQERLGLVTLGLGHDLQSAIAP
jgi:hypothetical protein